MRIYEHVTSVTTSAGQTSTVTLGVIGGLMQQLFIKANTSTTVFRVSLLDHRSDTRVDYGFHTGMLNDIGSKFPMVDKYSIRITNASPNDTFRIVLAVQE